MTAHDIIYTALRRINSVAPGEEPTAEEAAAGLESLNDMIDAWALERLMLGASQRMEFPLLKTPITVGPGADIDIPRPERIDRIGLMVYTNMNRPMELAMDLMTMADWQEVPIKNLPSSLATRVFDDDGQPWRTLTFWPQPWSSVGVVLYVWGIVDKFRDLSTEYEFPSGFADALKWNLAFRLASEFGGFMPPQVQMEAQRSIARIKSFNHQNVIQDLQCDWGLGGRPFNWLTGE